MNVMQNMYGKNPDHIFYKLHTICIFMILGAIHKTMSRYFEQKKTENSRKQSKGLN